MTSTQTWEVGSARSGRMWTGGAIKAIMTSTIKKNQHCISETVFLFLAENGCFVTRI